MIERPPQTRLNAVYGGLFDILLNADGVLSPSEYKRSLGMKYISGFKSNPQATTDKTARP